MNYKEYQKASLKHLNTCKVMLDSISLLSPNSEAEINNISKQKALLHNMFYLSGYTLECVITYSIYKHYKWDERYTIDTLDHAFSKKCNLAFYKDTPLFGGRGVYRYYIQGHNFQDYIQVLNRALPASKIPFVDRSVTVDPDVLKLYRAWQVEVRYHSSDMAYSAVTLNLDNVKKFVGTVDTVYIELMKKVG